MIIEQDIDNVRLITLNAPNEHNPFCLSLEVAVKDALKRADQDNSVSAIVVYGGNGRSFSAGGNFNEIKNLNTDNEIENWVDRVIDLYQSVLKVGKPTVAAIDGHAIGMGFQFALMFDQRVMASTAIFCMPELLHGIGCSVGAAILRHTHTVSTMKQIIYQCRKLNAFECEKYQIVDKIVVTENLLHEAIAIAGKMGNYPQTAFKNTKQTVNQPFLKLLEEIRDSSKSVHKAAFLARDAQKHFNNILGKNS